MGQCQRASQLLSSISAELIELLLFLYIPNAKYVAQDNRETFDADRQPPF